ncbi:MaoC family dehydratase N-terminal domain-containing protein [Streptomyces sp. NPDC056656]|uniref:FAS1-like dehydratase domain-containing protein n=1 Tax=Streptomyces sp. NPDC056656 TaxID=3345895 RepID=UPI003693C3D9
MSGASSRAVMPVEWGKVREYAQATAAARPVYMDDPHAPIPPTFLATVVFWTPIGETLRSPEVLKACAEAGVEADTRTLLSLEQEYVFHGPLPRAGDRLHTSERLRDIRVKQTRSGRVMVVVRFTVSFHDEQGERGGPSGQDERGGLRAECHYTSAFVQQESL